MSEPAFPHPEPRDPAFSTTCPGLTKREWFAGQCNPLVYAPFETLKAKLGRDPTAQEAADFVAAIRFMEADAMIAASKDEKQ